MLTRATDVAFFLTDCIVSYEVGLQSYRSSMEYGPRVWPRSLWPEMVSTHRAKGITQQSPYSNYNKLVVRISHNIELLNFISPQPCSNNAVRISCV